MSQKIKIRISLIAGIISWMLFSIFDTYFVILDKYEMKEAFAEIIPQVFLTLCIFSTLFYYRYLITKAESINFMDLLWRVFITGLVTTLFSLAFRLLFNLFANTSFINNPVTVNFFYHIYVGLVLIFLISTLVVWKRLILYQKSKQLINLWNIFEYLLFAALIFDFLGISPKSMVFSGALIAMGGFSLILSFNLKWIAYLNFGQKWKSILFILLSIVYLYHFFINLNVYSATELLTYDLLNRVFILSILLFIVIYAVIAILVTLFNLPTSSVFERKLQEAVDFQKLSQSVTAGQSEEETYEILIESSMSAVFADAAWMEVKQDNGETVCIQRNISDDEIAHLKEKVKHEDLKRILNLNFSGNISLQKVFTSVPAGTYKSIFALPVMVKNRQIGSLVLLQEVRDAFNREMVNIITTFVNQASIAIENARLLSEAIGNERYKEQLNIAKNVQKSLLPEYLGNSERFSISAYSVSADEVGGDYYDYLELENGKIGLIIGDVSGKGTSAAFNMAQMKGIFHSLAQFGQSAQDFVIKANNALSRCLERSSFITASYFLIDIEHQTIEHVRAGHCPALFYSAKKNEIIPLAGKGMGLGIVRNSEYANYVSSCSMQFEKGDILLLHTDGFTEASDSKKQQFGDEPLKALLKNNAAKTPEEIKDKIIEELFQFMNGKKLDDDYTLVITKFN